MAAARASPSSGAWRSRVPISTFLPPGRGRDSSTGAPDALESAGLEGGWTGTAVTRGVWSPRSRP